MNIVPRLLWVALACLLVLPGCISQQAEQALSVKGDVAKLKVDLKASAAQLDSLTQALSLQDLHLQEYVQQGNDQYLRAHGWKLISQTGNLATWVKPLAHMFGVADPGAFFYTQVSYNTFYPQADFGVNEITDRHIHSQNGQTTFFFRGQLQAKKVILSGSFNQWTTNHQPMVFADSGWLLTLPLQPGKHLYKFIVDGEWMPDPQNPLHEDDTHDGWNSVYFVENHTFQLRQPSAKEVRLLGSFQHWDDTGVALKRTATGWELPVFLAEGTHTYLFLVDGALMPDPANPNTRTLPNGKLVSVAGLGTPFTFRLNGFPAAKQVVLAGSFNDWDEHNDLMQKTETGWEYALFLGAGMHQYKFIVDGKWMIDPANPLQTGIAPMNNSVLMVRPNHTFVLNGFTGATSVRVTGDFLAWDRAGLPMQRTAAGWILPASLPPGKTTYSFLVDSHPIKDPANPLWEEDGRPNTSVVWVGKGAIAGGD